MGYGNYDFSLFLVVECTEAVMGESAELHRQSLPIRGEAVDWTQNVWGSLRKCLVALPSQNVTHAKFLDIQLHICGEGYVYDIPPLYFETELQRLLAEQGIGLRVLLSKECVR